MTTVPNFDRDLFETMLSRGLTDGLGTTEKACIMACLNLATGGGLEDTAKSPCVLPAAALFAIRLNDAKWSSEMARADGLRDLGYALLGTDSLDAKTFATRLAEATIREVIPVFLRRANLEDAANRCEAEGTAESAQSARKDAAAVATAAYAAAAATAAYADADAYAAADAAACAAAYADAAADAAAYAAAAATAAYDDAYDYAYADAYAYAAAAATARLKHGDETLILSAKIATRILTEMKASNVIS